MELEDKNVICRDLDGKEYEVSARDLTTRPSAYGVIIQDSKVLLSKQWDGYDFPGGKIEKGETIPEALIREIKEETGFNVQPGKLITIETSFFKPRNRSEYYHSFLMYYFCLITGGELSGDFLTEDEKVFSDAPEWIDLDTIDNVKFYNSIDSRAVLRKAIEMMK